MTDQDQPIHVFAVGHCGPDSWMLRSTAERALGSAIRFESFDEESRMRERLDSTSDPVLLLVNRKLDGYFDASDGIALIEASLAAGRGRLAAMLISNLSDALAQAEAVGAMPGFGKTALHATETATALQAAAERLRDS
ncbi:MAG: hypothetical protein RLZZ461_1193 [Planctomycetota bacterium]|jgi:hypothetical protein